MATAPEAHASVYPAEDHGVYEDVEIFHEAWKMGAKPGSEVFESMDGAAQEQILRGADFVASIERMSAGQPGAWADTWLSGATPSEEEFYDNVFEKYDGYFNSVEFGSEGSVEAEIGGEAATAADGLSVLAAPATLAIVAGVLAYEDITSGSNVVTRALFGGPEDHEAIEAGGGVAAEAMRWQKIDYRGCNESAEKCFKTSVLSEYGGSEATAIEEGHSGYQVEWHTKNNGYGKGEPWSPDYFGYSLEAKAGGEWWPGASCAQPAVPLTTGCLGGTEYSDIDGYPDSLDFLKHLEFRSGEHEVPGEGEEYGYSTSCKGPSGEEICYHIYHSMVFRPISRMNIGLPRSSTKSNVEKLEAEGHPVVHVTPSPSTESNLDERLSNLEKLMKEGYVKELEKFLEHEGGTGLHRTEEEPETPLHPPILAKEEGVPPPLPGVAEVPSCTLLFQNGSACESVLKASGFTKIEINPRTWEHAVLSVPANDVVALKPGAGSLVETSATIDVETNPSVMPLQVPTPGPHEVYTVYKEELEADGFTKVSEHVLPEIYIDPSRGPNEVTDVSPDPGTNTDPDGETPIEVEVNPEDAPSPSEEGGGITAPTLPAVKFPKIETPCTNFPFGVPCWFVQQVSDVATKLKAPSTEFVLASVGGYKVVIDLADYETWMEKVRFVEGVLGCIGVVLLFGRFAGSASGSSDGGGSSDDD